MNKRLSRGSITKLRNAAEKLHSSDPYYKRTSNIDFIVYLAVVIITALAIRSFIGEPVKVEGSSMYPTLHDGERMIVEKLSYAVGEPERGDIIVCYYPGFTVSCVKRVIGLPGDTVSIEDGIVYLNGKALNESAYWNDLIEDDMSEHAVEQGHVFVIGDNRNHSTDSRARSVGAIPYDKIVGKVICVVWPVNEIRGITHEVY